MKPYYNLSIRPGAKNVCAIAGKFSKEAVAEEILLGQDERLSLLSPDTSGKIRNLGSIRLGTSISSLAYARRPEGHTIFVGRMFLMVEYSSRFEIRSSETCEDNVQFVATSCQGEGHAILVVTAKQSIMYIAGNAAGLSPACNMFSDYNAITSSVVGLSGGHTNEKNICFAAIERKFSENDDPNRGQMHIAYYEATTEGTQQFKRSLVLLGSEASLLLAVPGGVNGPGGILVITKHMVIYKKRDFPDVSASFHSNHEHGALIVSATTCHNHEKFGLFYLLQTEFGEIFRVSLILGSGVLTGFNIEHLDTIPVTYAMCLLDSDLLFAASKTGSYAMYQFSSRKLSRMDKNERILKMGIMKLSGERNPSLILDLCSGGPGISLRKLSPWMDLDKTAETMLMDRPNALWRLNADTQERFSESIAVSYDNGTEFIDMSLDNETQIVLKNHKFDLNGPSLAVFTIGNGSLLRVHPKGIMQGQEDIQLPTTRNLPDEEFVNVAYNRFQVAVALRGGKLVYYAVSTDQGYDTLKERGTCQMNAEVVCLSIPPIPEGRNHSFRVAVGLADSRIEILVLEPSVPTEQVLQFLSVQTMLSPPQSLIFLSPQDNEPPYHYLIAGLENGLLIRMVMVSSGKLYVLFSQYLGSRTPKLFSIIVKDQQAIICLSDRPSIGYTCQQNSSCQTVQESAVINFLQTPLPHEALDFAASICCHRAQGVVAVTGDRIKLFTVGDLNTNFSAKTFSPDYTHKNFVLHPEWELIIVISEGQGKSSHIMILDPRSGKTLSSSELQKNETAHTVCTVNFDNEEHRTLLAVGISIHEYHIGIIRTYQLSDLGKSLAVLQNTYVEQLPRALSQFKGTLVAGIGPLLRMYGPGKGQLDLICESKIFPVTREIVSINVVGDRIYVEDNKPAMHCFRYSMSEKKLYVFEVGNVPSSMSAFLHIDTSSMACADKLGNVFFVQIPPEASNESSEEPSSSKTGGGKPYGSVSKVRQMCFHVGDIVTCLQNASLVPGGDECIIYGTERGILGALLPSAVEDAELLSGLEKRMSQDLCIRRRRKTVYPQHCVIDGDICEMFQTENSSVMKSIADNLGTTEIEILRKLGTTRNKII